jgi:hypothetical protein
VSGEMHRLGIIRVLVYNNTDRIPTKNSTENFDGSHLCAFNMLHFIDPLLYMMDLDGHFRITVLWDVELCSWHSHTNVGPEKVF